MKELKHFLKQTLSKDKHSKDSQIYLFPKEAYTNKIKNKLPPSTKMFVTESMPDSIFIHPTGLKRIDTTNPSNIKSMARMIGHEELHNELQRSVGTDAMTKLDNISLGSVTQPFRTTQKGRIKEDIYYPHGSNIYYPSQAKKINSYLKNAPDEEVKRIIPYTDLKRDEESKNDLTYLLALPIVHQPSLISSAYGYAKTRLNLMHKPSINLRRDKVSTNMAWEKGLDAEDIPLAKGRWQKGERTYTKKRVLMDPDEFLQRQYEQRPGKTSTYNEWVRSVSDTRIEKLKQAILDPKQKVPTPIEEYNRQGKRIDLQEGRHRGLAAQELGVQVPVILARQKAAPWDRINQDDHYTHKYEFEGEVPPPNNDWKEQ